MANTKVTGDLIASSTIATGNIADNAVTSDKISGITTAHITEGSNLYYTDARADARITAATTSDLTEGTNLYYTDARADARAALLVDSAPSTLDTLNELAAALGDDPNFATTVTNSIAAKLPLAGGTMTGDITISSTSPELKFVDTNSFTDTNDRWIVRGGADTLIMRWYDNSASSNTDVLTLSSTAATFAGAVTGAIARFDTLNNNANSANIIYRTGTNTIVGNNASALVVQDGGNVGIGTTGPGRGLTIDKSNANAALEIIKNNTTNQIVYLGTGSSGGTDDPLLRMFHNGTENIRLYTTGDSWINGGNVGIGETDPSGYWGQANNIVIDTSGNGGITIKSTSAGNGRLVFTDIKSTTAGNTDGGMIAYNHTDDEMRFQTNGGQRMVIDSSGNVGIGTTSPTNLLTINDPNANGAITDTIPSWWGLVIDRAYTTSSSAAMALIGGTVATGSSGRLYLGNSDNVTHTYIDGSANQVHFGVAGGERMRITGGGNVGIGVTPSEKLHIYGGGSGPEIRLQGTWGSHYIRAYNDNWNFLVGGTIQAIIIKNNGNVGIGATAPATELQIGDYTDATEAITIATSQNGTGRINFYDNNATEGGSIRVVGKADGSTMYFANRWNTDSDKITFDLANGNVGIGTTLPTTALTIGKAISPTAYGGGASMIEFKSYYPGYDTETVKSAIYSGVSGQTGLQTTRGFMSFWTADYVTGGGQSLTEKMRIESDGFVRIGNPSATNTYTPAQGYVAGISSPISGNQTYLSLSMGGSALGNTGVAFGLDAGGASYYMRDNKPIRFYTNNTFAMIIGAGGDVGIGTTTPYSRLDVNGVITNRTASADPNFTVTANGMSVQDSGSLQFTQGFAGTSSAGDTVVFRYNATSWKSWSLDYTFASTNGLVKGTIGGYNNNSGGGSNFFLINSPGITAVGTNSGQNVIVTFTGNFGIHMKCDMRYSQGGGDGAPRADRASLTYNS